LTLLIACFMLAGCGTGSDNQLEYRGAEYVPVAFKQDIFSCGLGVEGEFETDVTYAFYHPQFQMIHNSGDLYCVKSQIKEANAYYQDDGNYIWQVSLLAEDEGEDTIVPVVMSKEELDEVYQMENQEKDQAVFFDEIQQQATLTKISKDGVARGSIELALYKGKWYWRTEIIDESREQDGTWPEYIQPMPKRFQKKIKG